MRSVVALAHTVGQQHLSKKSVAIRNRYISRVFLFFCLGALILLCVVWTRVRVIALGYEVTRLHREVADLTQERAMLEAEVAKLKSPDRLERVAHERFHMRLPRGSEIIFIDQ